MSRTIILGATGAQSLAKHFVPYFLNQGVIPILVGRTAAQVSGCAEFRGCQFVSADLAVVNVAETIFGAVGDPSDITHLVIAGGGPHYRGALSDQMSGNLDAIWGSIVFGPAQLVRAFLARTTHSFHLVTIASTSAIRTRKDETVYATAQAARAVFARNVHYELVQRQGSCNTIFFPGGMKTGLWSDAATDGFMQPGEVARIMWHYITHPRSVDKPLEVQIDRAPNGSGTPVVTEL